MITVDSNGTAIKSYADFLQGLRIFAREYVKIALVLFQVLTGESIFGKHTAPDIPLVNKITKIDTENSQNCHVNLEDAERLGFDTAGLIGGRRAKKCQMNRTQRYVPRNPREFVERNTCHRRPYMFLLSKFRLFFSMFP